MDNWVGEQGGARRRAKRPHPRCARVEHPGRDDRCSFRGKTPDMDQRTDWQCAEALEGSRSTGPQNPCFNNGSIRNILDARGTLAAIILLFLFECLTHLIACHYFSVRSTGFGRAADLMEQLAPRH